MDHQYALYDTLVHVPLFVHGGPFDGGEIDDLVQLVDIPPTILDVLNIEAPDARKQFQGVSFHPDAEATRDHAVAEYLAPQPSMAALEDRVSELSDDVRTYDRSLHALRTDRYKYIRGSDGTQELYDVRADPDEADDITGAKPDTVTELDAQLSEWLNSFEHAESAGNVDMTDDTKSRLEDLGYLQ